MPIYSQPAERALQDLRFALDQSTIVAVTDTTGDIIYVNDKFCQISKYSRDELMGQNHRIICSRYHSTEFFQQMWQTITQGQVWHGEIKNRAKDGSHYWVDTTIVPKLDEAGTPFQYTAIRHDITERKQIEEELRLLNEGLEDRVNTRTSELKEANAKLKQALFDLQESEQLKQTFASALTHDLRTPLVAQERVLEIMQKHRLDLPDTLQPMVAGLQKSNSDLLTMVNRLLEIYQFEVGKVACQKQPSNLKKIIDTCQQNIMPLAHARQIEFINQLSNELPMVALDKSQITRVFNNLLGNAIENMNVGGVITLYSEVLPQTIAITIADNGPGIAADVLPNLFNRYIFAKQNKRRLGSGLGLSICKMIMELHDGDINVSSQLGEGTQFTLTFPLGPTPDVIETN